VRGMYSLDDQLDAMESVPNPVAKVRATTTTSSLLPTSVLGTSMDLEWIATGPSAHIPAPYSGSSCGAAAAETRTRELDGCLGGRA